MTADNPSSVGLDTAATLIPRIEAALAEAGYPHASVRLMDDGDINASIPGGPVPHVAWRAFAVAGAPVACWSCWINYESDDCTHPVVLTEAPL